MIICKWEEASLYAPDPTSSSGGLKFQYSVLHGLGKSQSRPYAVVIYNVRVLLMIPSHHVTKIGSNSSTMQQTEVPPEEATFLQAVADDPALTVFEPFGREIWSCCTYCIKYTWSNRKALELQTDLSNRY